MPDSPLGRNVATDLPAGYVPYVIDIQVRCVGYPPSYSNRAAPEMSRVAEAATVAARRIVEDAGFVISGTGHGSKRTDLP